MKYSSTPTPKIVTSSGTSYSNSSDKRYAKAPEFPELIKFGNSNMMVEQNDHGLCCRPLDFPSIYILGLRTVYRNKLSKQIDRPYCPIYYLIELSPFYIIVDSEVTGFYIIYGNELCSRLFLELNQETQALIKIAIKYYNQINLETNK